MEAIRIKRNGGLTLIEAMLSILVLGVIVTGTSGYRYYAATDTRRAVKETTAAKIALLLNEGWRGVLGYNTYDPLTQLAGAGLNIEDSGSGPATPDGFSLLNGTKYKVVSDGASYFITMAQAVTDTDENDTAHKRTALTTIVAWPVTANETTYAPSDYHNVVLTTYVEKGI